MLLKSLAEAFGPPGQEGEVREIIRQEIASHVDDLWTDSLGNLMAVKKGPRNNPKIMLCAHMDEVALMVTHIEKNGFLRFRNLGGIDHRVLISKRVEVGPGRISGVIGTKPIHLLEPEAQKKAISIRDLYIDIGAKDRKDAEKVIEIGTGAIFPTKCRQYGSNKFLGKALDNRVGCAALVELLRRRFPITLFAAFTTQEEVGLRGARVAAYAIKPDLALVLETTTGADVPDSKPHQKVASLGKGPALTLMDRTMIAHPKVLAQLKTAAQRAGTPFQLRRTSAGGTDGGAIHQTGEGIPTGVAAIPCRYLHSPVSVIDLNDYHHLLALVDMFIRERGQGHE